MDLSSSSDSSSDSSNGEELFVSVVMFINHLVEESSRVSRRVRVNRDRAAANDLLVRDYFTKNQIYNDKSFKRRFRMSRPLFLRIVRDLEREFEYFQQKYDARRKLGFTALQKCTSAIRQLVYGKTTDSMDEYLKMADKTSRNSLFHFCEGIISLYGKKYLRKPTKVDIHKLYDAHESVHGLPGMLGSIDCMHWEWENCPTAWRGQHQRGDHPWPTLMLEAIASNDHWIWHAFFGTLLKVWKEEAKQSIIVHHFNEDVRGNSSALFDDIEGGDIKATSSYSSHEIDEHENDRAMDGLQDRVLMLKRGTIWIHQEACSLELWINSRRFLTLNQAEGCLRSWLRLLWVS
ncbi:hypothetical protein L1987_60338 [Smallanthus sonchifolius]|uniref:Uncharacterized protein n=1 Tax=Smallanthus sonchifolius TaxID=185202 RepID=A0ACB9D8K9_9ASTR|nr:hypothetical protein L1987_60338 [Smallanthus sonchifolius]